MLLRLAFREGTESDYILFIPFISAFLIYILERKQIFVDVQFCPGGAAAIVASALALYWVAGRHAALGYDSYFSLRILGIVLIWIGVFYFCYGAKASRAALFPLSFLILMVPIPDVVLDRIIFWLQQGSSEAVFAIFKGLGIPVLRERFTFFLPGVAIEVAKECSGIHSSIAMFIFCLLSAHVFFRAAWSKASLFLIAFPLVIIKNAVRIVTLSLIAIYWYPDIFNSTLHHRGGALFYVPGFVILAMTIRLFQKLERSRDPAIPAQPIRSTVAT